MIKADIFRVQIVNSVVNHITSECKDQPEHDYMQFMIRSELQRRHRESLTLLPSIGMSTSEQILRSIAIMFFDGDIQACTEQWQSATIDDESAFYEIEMSDLGRTKIGAIDLSRNLRTSV